MSGLRSKDGKPLPATDNEQQRREADRATRLERAHIGQNLGAGLTVISLAILIGCVVNPTGLYGQTALFFTFSAVGLPVGGAVFYVLTQTIAALERPSPDA